MSPDKIAFKYFVSTLQRKGQSLGTRGLIISMSALQLSLEIRGLDFSKIFNQKNCINSFVGNIMKYVLDYLMVSLIAN